MANSNIRGLQIEDTYESDKLPMLMFDVSKVEMSTPLGYIVFMSYNSSYMDLRLV